MWSRTGWVVVAVSLLSSTAWAQEGLRSASLPERTPQRPIPMSPSPPGVRSGSLPDRSPQNPIPAPRVDQFLAHRRTFTPRLPGEPIRRHNSALPIGGYGYYGNDVSTPRQDVPETIPTGYLYLQLQPGTAQVVIDGLYTGTVDDFRRVIPGRAIEAGAHRVELRAAGYETAAFDVLIRPGDTTSYRSDLRTTPRERSTALSGAPKPFYVIPGCYAGDKPPAALSLRKGCDHTKVRVIPPTVNTVAHNR